MDIAIINWTTLFVVLSPLFVAFLRRDSMSANQVAAVTLGVVVATFFSGRFLGRRVDVAAGPVACGGARRGDRGPADDLPDPGQDPALRALESIGNGEG